VLERFAGARRFAAGRLARRGALRLRGRLAAPVAASIPAVFGSACVVWRSSTAASVCSAFGSWSVSDGSACDGGTLFSRRASAWSSSPMTVASPSGVHDACGVPSGTWSWRSLPSGRSGSQHAPPR
jgi:hypothetical protein